MSDDTDRYAWFEATSLAEAACLTFVKGSTLEQVAWAFGGDLADAVPMELPEAYDPEVERFFAALRPVGEWVVVVEENGWQGSRPEVLRRLTGQTVSLYRNINALTAFSVAAHGSVLTTFEALNPDHRTGEDPDAIEHHRVGLPWDDLEVGLMQLMLALAERVSGFALRPEHLTGAFPVVPLLAWPEDVPTVVRHLGARDDQLSDAIDGASDAVRYEAAWVAVRYAAAVADALHDAVLAPILAGSPTPEQIAALDEYSRHLQPQERWPLFRTVEAARAALSPHSHVAVWEAVRSAEYALGSINQPRAPIRTAVLAQLNG